MYSPCKCGCGQVRLGYGYIRGHHSRTPDHRAALSKAAKNHTRTRGPKSGRWKGDDVGYSGVHTRIRKRFLFTGVCVHCGKERSKQKAHDIANISGQYLDDTSDYLELCRSCHQQYDKEKRNVPTS